MLPYVQFWRLSIPLYGLMILLGLFLGCSLAVTLAKKAKLPWEELVIIMTCAVAFGAAGSSSLYAMVTYPLRVISQIIAQGEFAALLGGSVFYGGLLAGIFGAAFGAKIAKVSLGRYEGAIIPALPLVHAFGRIGCFFAGCCYGILVQPPLGLAFSQPVGGAPPGVPLLPIQLVEAFLNLVLCGALLLFLRKQRRAPRWVWHGEKW